MVLGCTIPMMLSNKTEHLVPTETTIIEEEFIDPSEWFVTDIYPTQFPAQTEPTEIIEPTEPTEPTIPEIEPTEPPTEVPSPGDEVPSVPDSNEVIWYSDYRVYPTNEITSLAGGAEFDIDFFAKLLYCEAGGMTWEGQVYTASAILNFCDRYKISMWEAGHTTNMFAVAPWVDEANPKQMQYDVIEYVLNGGRIGEICHFRSKHYHTFGTPICQVDGHYFSIA